jgi:hypothetical protein
MGWGGRQEERVTELAKEREGDSLTGKDREGERQIQKGGDGERRSEGVRQSEVMPVFLTALQSGPNCGCRTPPPTLAIRKWREIQSAGLCKCCQCHVE